MEAGAVEGDVLDESTSPSSGIGVGLNASSTSLLARQTLRNIDHTSS